MKIAIVDDHPLFLMGTRMAMMPFYDLNLIRTFSSGKEFLESLPSFMPDVVLLDIIMPEMNGLQVTEKLRAEYQNIKILILSAETDEETILKAVEIGVNGFISKASQPNDIYNAIETIADGADYFGRDIAQILNEVAAGKKMQDDVFSPRELEIIRYCADGLMSKEIAEKLSISARTVEGHKLSIFRKMGISNTAELIKYSVKHGIVRL
ncbi:MAG: response regulator transcription factor [Bacteroidales bacterium]|nr:response regulator transcription factor [Bacteroidales bacterium]MBR6067706.1 response regulator transcription factor [Bacteroidales bacterium]